MTVGHPIVYLDTSSYLIRQIKPTGEANCEANRGSLRIRHDESASASERPTSLLPAWMDMLALISRCSRLTSRGSPVHLIAAEFSGTQEP